MNSLPAAFRYLLLAMVFAALLACGEEQTTRERDFSPLPQRTTVALTPDIDATVEAAVEGTVTVRTTSQMVGTAVAEALATVGVPAQTATTAPISGASSPDPPPDVAAVPAGQLEATVTWVVDGDTVDVRFDDGSTDRVRLLGVDTPETFSPNNPYEYGTITNTACLDLWGDEATEFATLVLDRQTVTLVGDAAAGERGSFGRLLRYVYVEGDDFNAVLVELGYARAYIEGDSSRVAEYVALEAQARAQDLGLWACKGTVSSSAEAPSVTCDPSYPDVCIAPRPPDLNCADVPYRRFKVLPPDPHRFDGDKDGVGCES